MDRISRTGVRVDEYRSGQGARQTLVISLLMFSLSLSISICASSEAAHITYCWLSSLSLELQNILGQNFSSTGRLSALTIFPVLSHSPPYVLLGYFSFQTLPPNTQSTQPILPPLTPHSPLLHPPPPHPPPLHEHLVQRKFSGGKPPAVLCTWGTQEICYLGFLSR